MRAEGGRDEGGRLRKEGQGWREEGVGRQCRLNYEVKKQQGENVRHIHTFEDYRGNDDICES